MPSQSFMKSLPLRLSKRHNRLVHTRHTVATSVQEPGCATSEQGSPYGEVSWRTGSGNDEYPIYDLRSCRKRDCFCPEGARANLSRARFRRTPAAGDMAADR